jgi:hypothetical protein
VICQGDNLDGSKSMKKINVPEAYIQHASESLLEVNVPKDDHTMTGLLTTHGEVMGIQFADYTLRYCRIAPPNELPRDSTIFYIRPIEPGIWTRKSES